MQYRGGCNVILASQPLRLVKMPNDTVWRPIWLKKLEVVIRDDLGANSPSNVVKSVCGKLKSSAFSMRITSVTRITMYRVATRASAIKTKKGRRMQKEFFYSSFIKGNHLQCQIFCTVLRRSVKPRNLEATFINFKQNLKFVVNQVFIEVVRL